MKRVVSICLIIVSLGGIFLLLKPKSELDVEYTSEEGAVKDVVLQDDVLGLADNFPEEEEETILKEITEEDSSSISNTSEVIEIKTIHMLEDESHMNNDLNITPQSQSALAERGVSELITYENTLNDREVMGFMPYWQMQYYDEIQYDKLSTLAYFGLTCNGDGYWVSDSGSTAFYSAEFDDMVSMAHANNVKVVPVIKNFDNVSIKRLVGNFDGAGDRLINKIVEVVRDNGLDGVNIDFEYIADGENPVTDTLRSNFADWHQQLAERMDSEFPGSHVSTDVFGSSASPGTAYDLVALGNTDIDYIMMMTYDYIVTSYWDGKKIAPMSPLYGNNLYGTPNWNVSSHVTAASGQAGSTRILMGIPYYGIDFPVQSAQAETYNAYVTSSGLIESYKSIMNPVYDQWHNDSTIRWNSTEKATWYTYDYYGQRRHAYYDDERSIGAKYDFVRDNDVGGVAIWALGYDAGYTELWDVMRDKFQIAPFIVGVKEGYTDQEVTDFLDGMGIDVVEKRAYNVWEVQPRSILSSVAISNLKEKPDWILGAGFESLSVDRYIE